MAALEERLELIGLPRLGSDVKGKVDLKINIAKEAKDFEHAQHNIKRMKDIKANITKLLKRRFRVNPYRMEQKILEKELKIEGDKLADVQFELRYQKTSYQSIVEGVETQLQGIMYNAIRGSDIVDVLVDGAEPSVYAQRLLDDCSIVLAGNLGPNIECNVKPIKDFEAPTKFVIIPTDSYKEISWNMLSVWVQLITALPPEEKYVKLYKKKAVKGAPKKGKRVTPTEEGEEVVEGSIGKRDTIDYMDIVRTLIPVPMEYHEKTWDPELPYLIGKDLSLKQKQKSLPWYELLELPNRRKRQEAGTYVGVQSVLDRIEDLRDGNTDRIKIPVVSVKPAF